MKPEDQLAFLRDLGGSHRGFAPNGLWRGWTLASDGYSLVAIRGDLGLGAFDGAERALKTVDGLLDSEPAGAPVDAGLLQGWCGRTWQDRSTCDVCEGSGFATCPECFGEETTCVCPTCDDEHAGSCSVCDGQGKEPCRECSPAGVSPRREGWIGGVPFNLNLVANALRLAPDGPLAVRTERLAERDARLYIYGEGYRAVVMALVDAPEKAPRFELQVSA